MTDTDFEALVHQSKAMVERFEENRCEGCGEPKFQGRCFSCEDARRAANEALASTRRSFRGRFEWTVRGLRAPELEHRVDLEALERARKIDVTAIDRITLMGPAGSGKSSIACAIAAEWCRKTREPAMLARAVDLGVARAQHDLGQGEPRDVRSAMTAGLLILDDVGAEVASGAQTVGHVIRSRYDDARPTITTTGLTVAQLIDRYDAGVARRLVETAGGAVVLQLRGRKARGEVA